MTNRVTLAKYQTLFENFPLGITVSDKAGKIQEANALATELLGISKEEQIQRQLDGEQWQIIRTDGTPMPSEEYASVRALKEGCKIADVEMGIMHPDKRVTWLNVTAAPIPLEPYGVVVTFHDITERKEAESSLRTSEQNFRLISENTTDFIFAYDMDRHLMYANPAIEKLTGYCLSELQEQNFINWIHPDDESKMLKLWEDVFEGKGFAGEEFRIITRDGQIRWSLSS